MDIWELLEVASMPILQVFLISAVGAFLATGYLNHLLSTETRRSLNKIVFMVFTPSLIFSSLAETVTLREIISWWFMPVNIGLIFLLGSIIGWIIVKLLRPGPKLEGLVIATCSAGNLGNLLIVILPQMCNQSDNPFGSPHTCRSAALSYASFSMALGGIFVWTHTYHIMRSSYFKCKEIEAEDDSLEQRLVDEEQQERGNVAVVVAETPKYIEQTGKHIIVHQKSFKHLEKREETVWHQIMHFLNQILEELLAPPTVGAILGLIFGAIAWLRNLLVGEKAPLRVIQDSLKLLGEGTTPCITLLLGGNLIEGIRSSKVKPVIILWIIFAKYIVLPVLGVLIVRLAGDVGLLPSDPMFRYTLMVQYTMPPAMGISTMTQLFDVGQEESAVILLWTYVAAAVALTAWSTIFMSIIF